MDLRLVVHVNLKERGCKIDKMYRLIDRSSPLSQFIHDTLWNFHEFIIITFLATTENVILRDHDTEMS